MTATKTLKGPSSPPIVDCHSRGSRGASEMDASVSSQLASSDVRPRTWPPSSWNFWLTRTGELKKKGA